MTEQLKKMTLSEARAHVLETLRQIDEERLALAEIEATQNRYCLDPSHESELTALRTQLATARQALEKIRAHQPDAYPWGVADEALEALTAESGVKP